MRRLRCLLLALACTVAGSAAAGAEPWSAPFYAAPKKPAGPATPSAVDVETAEQLYVKLEFDDANKVADKVVKLRGLTHDQLVRAYKILAVTHGFLDREDQARDAFVLLLTYEPDFQLDPNLGPKVSQPFVEARGFWRAQSSKPGVEVTADLRPKEAGALRVTTHDPTHVVKKVLVGYRWSSMGEYQTGATAPGTGVSIEIPPPPPGKSRVEYYAQALDEHEDVAFEVGSPAAPKTALLDTGPVSGAGASGGGGERERGGSGVFASPVFWTIAGAVVIGGAVTGGYFLFRPKDVTASSATLTPSLQCGTVKCN